MILFSDFKNLKTLLKINFRICQNALSNGFFAAEALRVDSIFCHELSLQSFISEGKLA